MSVKSGQVVVAEFTTHNPTTGAAADATGTPTAVLTVNGVDNAASVTVANKAVGEYKATVTLPSLSAGDMVAIIVSATVAAVAAKGKIWEEVADTKRVSDLNDIAAGAQMDLVNAPNATALAAVKTKLEEAGSSLAQILTDTGELQTDWHDGGRLDLLLDAAAAAGDPWGTAVPGVYAEGTAGHELYTDMVATLAAIKLMTDQLASLTLTVTSPLTVAGDLTIHRGDDYLVADSTQFIVAIANPTHSYGLDDPAAKVQIRTETATIDGTAVSTDAGYNVTFAPTSTETAALPAGRTTYHVWFKTAAGKEHTSEKARLNVTETYEEV